MKATEQMTANYLIMDATANSDRVYINEHGENCSLEENAVIFSTQEDADNYIKNHDWCDWAVSMETDYPVNV